MKDYSKTFCPYPWIHVMTQPSGTVNFCCVANGQIKTDDSFMEFDGMQTGDVLLLSKGGDMRDVWNSKHYKHIRRQMDTGERVIGCEPCYELEDLGIPSYRENYIKDWMGFHRNADEIERIIDKSRENDYHVDEPPQYLDFRLGTLCNLRCRMCQSQNSSAIYKELKDDELYTQEERDFVVKHTHWNDFSDYTQPWFDTPEFLEAVEEWLPNVNRLYFTGGEPTIIQRTYWILEKCVELGIAKDIDLVFNSNMTNIQPRFIDLLAKFRDVLMCLSVDGYAQYNEYIRSGSTWTVVDKHIKDYATSEVVGNILFSPVVQIYNILNITDLLDYAEEITKFSGRRIDISFLMNNYPKCLDIRNLPKHVRVEGQKRLRNWLNTSKYFKDDERNLATVEGIIKALEDENVNADAEKQMQIFKEYTELLDNKRDQSFKDSIPDLWRMLND
jgi:sulfatase maturation enzyme AslB (radical SAM superfamily)|tara:strand:- start:1994 stop:3325 length:1332 start_codon:yes stop_codon:yes gene_type:complete